MVNRITGGPVEELVLRQEFGRGLYSSTSQLNLSRF